MTTAVLSRSEYLSAHAGTTRADLAFALELAESPAEVDQVAHLTLALFGMGQVYEPFTEHGRDFSPLHQLVAHHRNRVDGFGPERARDAQRMTDALEYGAHRRRAEAKDAYAKREEKIRRFGFTNAERL